ncbi:MAG: choice-of-anchor E domain-containing protein [Planctomycetota bacterium]
MTPRSAAWALACAAALLLPTPAEADASHGHADAPGTKSMEANYEFQLFSGLPGDGFDSNDEFWSGGQVVQVGQFDPGLGTLNSVKLSIGMNIAGSISVFDPGQLQPTTTAFDASGFDDGYGYDGGLSSLIFSGNALAGPLNAEVDFGSYDFGIDGFVFDSELVFDESGQGQASSLPADNLDGFIGAGDVPVGVFASLIADYETQLQAGNSIDPIVASGWVRLTYDFDAANIVPSPTAATGGLALLIGVALRRRKRRF